MNELNRKTLKQAVSQLLPYEPKEFVWESLSQELERVEAEQPLQKAIRQLPTYVPPEAIWQHIETELRPKRTITRQMLSRGGVAVAASVCLLVAAGWWLWVQHTPKIEIAYSVEILEEEKYFTNDWDSEEDAFAMVAALCEVRQFACEQPEFKDLEEELKELNEAKAEVKAAIERYGQDARFVAQLVRIEQERSDVLKQLVKLI